MTLTLAAGFQFRLHSLLLRKAAAAAASAQQGRLGAL